VKENVREELKKRGGAFEGKGSALTSPPDRKNKGYTSSILIFIQKGHDQVDRGGDQRERKGSGRGDRGNTLVLKASREGEGVLEKENCKSEIRKHHLGGKNVARFFF